MSNDYLDAIKRGAIDSIKTAPRDFFSPVVFACRFLKKAWLFFFGDDEPAPTKSR